MKKGIFSLILVIFVLLGVSYFYLGFETLEKKPILIHQDKVRGTAVEHNEQLFTLNFQQETELLEELNGARRVRLRLKEQEKEEIVEIPSLYVYLFEEDEPLILKPIKKDLSLFTVSNWKSNEYLSVEDPDSLKLLLVGAYD